MITVLEAALALLEYHLISLVGNRLLEPTSQSSSQPSATGPLGVSGISWSLGLPKQLISVRIGLESRWSAAPMDEVLALRHKRGECGESGGSGGSGG